MNIILLGGNNKSNKEWIESVKDSVADLFENQEVLYYSHWDSQEKKDIDMDLEVIRLKELSEKLGDFIIFAKSAGALLTLKALKMKQINPQKVILAGIPGNWAKENSYDFENWLENLDQEITFIQQEKDPMFYAEELQGVLETKSLKNYKLVKSEGESHNYDDLNLLRKHIKG